MTAVKETSYRSAHAPRSSKFGTSVAAMRFLKSSSGISKAAENAFASRSTSTLTRPSTAASSQRMPSGNFFRWHAR